MLITIATSLVYYEVKDMVLKKIFSEIFNEFWGKWELRLMIVVSLILQILLVISAHIRRRYIGKCLPYVAMFVWLVYLLTDWIATLVLTTLLRGAVSLQNELIVFWTPFLLWHLGSPHNITAYSLEDNELWLRHFFGLFLQVGEAIYIYFRFRSTSSIALNAMSVPIFIAEIIKYGERIWSLRCASDKQLVSSFFSIPDKKASRGKKSIRTGLSETKVKDLFHKDGVIPEVDFLREAYVSFVVFKPLFTDLPFRISRELHDDRVYLKSKSAVDAFKLVDNELSFVYDMFFTKNPIQYRHLKVCLFLRSLCFLSAICSLIAFTVAVDRRDHSSVDIVITYLLLGGAIFLDAYSFVVHSLSIWAMIKLPVPRRRLHKLYAKIVAFRLKIFKPRPGIKSMAQHNLIKFCVKATTGSCTGAVKLFDTGNLLQKYGFTKWRPVNTEMKDFIYDHLLKKRLKCNKLDELGNKLDDKIKGNHFKAKFKEMLRNDADFGKFEDELMSIFPNKLNKLEKLLNEKGDNVFKGKFKEMLGKDEDLEKFQDEFMDIFPRMDPTYFIRSIFIWHIATELAYYDDYDNHRIGGARSLCNISKSLSDYMIYLALVRPTMLCKGFSDVINAKIFKDAQGFLLEKMKPNVDKARKQFTTDLLHFAAFQQQSYYQPPRHKVGAVLLEGAHFAVSLQKLVGELRWDDEEKWRMISDVWMEMFIYAATHCSWKEHAQQLRHGGELLTHVALIMAHLGLTTKVARDDEQYDSDALPPFDA